MATTFSIVSLLVRKLRGAHPMTRKRIDAFIADIKMSGAIPLGLAKDASGNDAYWWVVYDGSRFPPGDALMDYLKGRSPSGYTVAVLTV